MRMNSNTILITGGSSGIGRGLAEAFHKIGNRVIIGGRREARLKEICASNGGMNYFVLDVTEPASIRTVVREAISRFPELNVVINCAGVQREHDFSSGRAMDERALREEIDTNLAGLIRVCAEVLLHLQSKPEATLINVSSALAFVPLAKVPVYCATKAAVHSFCLSLRRQLRESGVKVIELIPPYVDTELQKGRRRSDGPKPMPLDQFISETMAALAGNDEEIAIGPARFLRGEASEGFRQAFARMNG
jgi:uncharacterized oxidoreductase